ncbi:MAG: hypothetical protein JXA79_05045, partial [Deltaproteobacteria bacterium]|nr:hypothetical protein [Deltaproteobacteria bacterium]
MKKSMMIIVVLICSCIYVNILFAAANTWTQKTDFGGEERSYAVGFSIGDKGYVGTGYGSITQRLDDFWEYDPDANTWTQKADFGGTGRSYATGFSIGDKGYIGMGTVDVEVRTKDFWEYEPEDTTPDQFAFTDQIDVEPDTEITSNTITIEGINATASVSIAGGTYSVNSGAYTSADGTVDNGDTLTVQQTS